MAFSMIISHPAIGLPPHVSGQMKICHSPPNPNHDSSDNSEVVTMYPLKKMDVPWTKPISRWMFHDKPISRWIFHELSLTKPSSYWVFPIYGTAFFSPRYRDIRRAQGLLTSLVPTVGDSQGPWRGIPPIGSVQRGKGMEKVWFGHAK